METPAAPEAAAPTPAPEAMPDGAAGARDLDAAAGAAGAGAARQAEAETVMTALKREVEKEASDARPRPSGRRRSRRRSRAPAAATAEPEEAPAAQPNRSTAAATSLPAGPPMTGAEKDGLKLAVQRCWNVPAGPARRAGAEGDAGGRAQRRRVGHQRLDPDDRAEPGAGRALQERLRAGAARADPLFALYGPAPRQVSRSGRTSKSSSTPKGWCHGRPFPAQPPDRRAGGSGAEALRRRGAGAAEDRDHRGRGRADALRGAGLRARRRRGGPARRADHPGGHRRPERHRPLPRGAGGGAYRDGRELRRAGRIRRLEGGERAGADHRRGRA